MPCRRAAPLAALLCIVAVGFALRIYRLRDNPFGFFCDEASIGFNAFSVLTTGKDEYGAAYPIFFRSFGDYRPPIAVYSTIPFVLMFGLTEFSVRLHSVFYGAATIMLLYLVGRAGWSTQVGLYTAIVGATMPWLIHYNRTGFEFSVYVGFFLGSIYLLFKASHNPKYISSYFVMLALTFYTYQPAKLMVLLLLCGSLVIYRPLFLGSRRGTATGMGWFLLLSVPLLLSFLRGEATARFAEVSILASDLPLSASLEQSLDHYILQLTPQFLFTRGEPTPIVRHFVGGLTPLLIVTAPFLACGIFVAIRHSAEQSNQLLLLWLTIYPVAGAVVDQGPFSSRSVIGAPLFALLTAVGLAAASRRVTAIFGGAAPVRVAAVAALVLGMLMNVYTFGRFYFLEYPSYSAGFWGWQYGPREIVAYFSDREDAYDDEILVPEFNAPHIFFNFYAPNGCRKCQIGWHDDLYQSGRRQLWALTPTYLEERPLLKFEIEKTVHYPDGEVAFVLGEIANWPAGSSRPG